jgi:outer membrane protein assembly factor BamB
MDIRSTPAIVNNKLYIGNYCIDTFNGNIIWNSQISVPLLSSATIYNNTVYVGSIDELMYSYNVEDGKTVWDHYIGSMVWESSPASAYGNIYVGNAFGYVYCLNATTGDRIWTVKKSCRSVYSPAISDGKVYIGSSDGNIYCFDAFTGVTIWNYQSSEPFECSPAIADGKVFIGSGNMLFCFGEDQRSSSDLKCNGTVIWSDVKPNSFVTGNFTVENIGKNASTLDWKIVSFPEWGNWTFSATEGYGLEPNDGFITVEFSVMVPNIKKDSFQGNIKIINSYNSSDYGIINISMSTMKNKNDDVSCFYNTPRFFLSFKRILWEIEIPFRMVLIGYIDLGDFKNHKQKIPYFFCFY